MLNRIWFWLLFLGIIYGFGKAAFVPAPPTDQAAEAEVQTETADGTSPQPTAPATRIDRIRDAGQNLTDASLGAAETAVKICIGLIGTMVLWLGMLNIAKDAGLVDAIANALRPFMRWLFPAVPDGHPAQGAMLMNIAANMLGLGNAATPFGIKAMKELQTLNPTEDTATNAMATFLAINTSSVTLIPITVIGLRVAADSQSAAGPLIGTLMTTTVTTIVAIIAVRMLSRLPRFATEATPAPQTDESDSGSLMKALAVAALVVGLAFCAVFYFVPLEKIRLLADAFSQWTIPLAMLIIILWGVAKKVLMYESFVTGAKEGFDVAVMIIPYLVAILFVIKVFMASGIFEDMKWMGGWMLAQMGMDAFAPTLDLLPLALTRPLTGGGAQGVLVEIFTTHGPDSFLGNTASLMMGSTETTFYVLTVYFGAVQVKKLRHTLLACLIADFVGITTAIAMGYFLFG